MSPNKLLIHPLRPVLWLAVFLMLLGPLTSSVAAAPAVDGLFYGPDDAFSEDYVHWDTSYYGSKLFVAYDGATTTLFVALVVDRSVNDNVFGESDPDEPGNYMGSAGWGRGDGQQRSAADLINSEFATFEFACAPDSPNVWEWQQGYACDPTSGDRTNADWVSDDTCGTSGVIQTGFPPSLQSSSSFAWNMNRYETNVANGNQLWDREVFGTTLGDWKSPFDPNDPNDVTVLDGYPDTGDITFDDDHEYEWPMVYEWSLNVGSGGTNCTDNQLFLITGASHHSPMKEGVEGLFDDECGEENDCFPPGDDDNNPLSDYGDLPDGYSTVEASNGAQHYIVVDAPYLGETVAIETDGQPTGDATGDGDEEDGVDADVSDFWTAGSTQSIEVEVVNGPALLGGWFDWNNDGDLDDAGEFFTWSVTEGTNTLDLTVGSGFDWEEDDLYARFRVFSSGSAAPGGSLDQSDSVGVATDGEVEDYFFQAGSLPVTLSFFSSDGMAGGELTARWQTASETDNIGFELWGLVDEEWEVLHALVPSQGMNSALPQNYEIRVEAPTGLRSLQLVGYDSRGRTDQFGPFGLQARSGEPQPANRIDWTGPRAERVERLRQRGFADVSVPGSVASTSLADGAGISGSPGSSLRSKAGTGSTRSPQWKKVASETVRPEGVGALANEMVFDTRSLSGREGGESDSVLETGSLTHVAVTEPGIQRVTYEDLRSGGLDLSGVNGREIAVTWRGEPVARWIDGSGRFGPGSAIEFLGHPPQGDEALYIDAALYQVAVDPTSVREAKTIGQGHARSPSEGYWEESVVDRRGIYHPQSPTGDPWIDRIVLARRNSTRTVTLDLPVDGPILDGPSELLLSLGTITDLPTLTDDGTPLEEHHVEVTLNGNFVTSSSTSGQTHWSIAAELPSGALREGTNQLELEFSTPYYYSLVVIDHYGVRYPTSYRGPSLDFAADPEAGGYRIEGFGSSSVAAYAESADGSLQQIDIRVSRSGGAYAAEVRQIQGADRFWVTESPHRPAIFTTEAPGDLLERPGDLVVVADSSFIGTPALDEYLAQKTAFDPVVVDVADIYNAAGYGMALPGAITDYLRARNAVHPFTHVQLVGTDCYDRQNYRYDCLSMIPLPTARVGVTFYSPSQNRLVDLDGDGVGDKAIGQFSVRDLDELATIVRKGSTWETTGPASTESALLIAEETDGIHDFLGQVERMGSLLGWPATETLDLAEYADIRTAREELKTALDDGQTVTVFSGHSSPVVWTFGDSILTADTVSALTNFDAPTLMVPLACEATYDISPNANVLGHQLLFSGEQGALAISGAVSLSSYDDNERMAEHVLQGLREGLTLGEAVLAGREALGPAYRTLQDNWVTQGDVTARLGR